MSVGCPAPWGSWAEDGVAGRGVVPGLVGVFQSRGGVSGRAWGRGGVCAEVLLRERAWSDVILSR